MLRSRMSIALAIAAVAPIAAAQPEPAFDKLERALRPAGACSPPVPSW